jgi:hypothetical protein
LELLAYAPDQFMALYASLKSQFRRVSRSGAFTLIRTFVGGAKVTSSEHLHDQTARWVRWDSANWPFGMQVTELLQQFDADGSGLSLDVSGSR